MATRRTRMPSATAGWMSFTSELPIMMPAPLPQPVGWNCELVLVTPAADCHADNDAAPTRNIEQHSSHDERHVRASLAVSRMSTEGALSACGRALKSMAGKAA